MTVISLRFLVGRVHATPWGRQVNEGIVEWPFSPWRILRALISTWHHKAKDAVSELTLRGVVEKLAAETPFFYLPRATTAHTRHYMPYIEGSKQKTTKIFDTFVHIQDGEPVEVSWPTVELAQPETEALHVLLERLGYFGRAESLVEAKLREEPAHSPNARPLLDGALAGNNEELVRIIAPMSSTDYRIWRDGYETAMAATSPKPVKKGTGKARASDSSLPAGIFEALLADTGDLKRSGWSQPPGARWIDYARPQNVFEMRTKARVSAPAGPLPTVARFAVTSQVLPRLTQAVSVAERVHQSLVKLSGNAPVFTGLDPEGRPLKTHEHARILCEPAGERNSITRITLYAPMGFDANARQALDQLRRVWGHGGHDLQLILLGLGQASDFAGLDPSRDQSPLLVEASEWKSLTPFVPTRHRKSHHNGGPKRDEYGLQIGSPEHDLCRLIADSGLPRPAAIRPMSAGRRELHWLSFQRERKYGSGIHAGLIGYGFVLTFQKPVRGPLTFGYASHFGLGVFVPTTGTASSGVTR